MTLPVFVVAADALQRDVVTLDGAEGRHAAAVRRIRVGERIMLTDGLGRGADCEVLSVGKAALECAVLIRREEPSAVPRLTVVQAIPKGEHADRAVDLLTEVGVDTIVPWAAARNVVAWRGDRAAKGLARWRAVAAAAAKQSRRLRFPDVREVATTGEVAALVRGAELGLVLHASAGQSLAELIGSDDAASRVLGPDGTIGDQASDSGVTRSPASRGDVVVVVGPEGGITDDELAAFRGAGAQVVHLGPTVLRSSSAGVAAAAVLLSHTNRWR
jgi:16S rRNA (uracil1498-N3)-methyltransferase